MASRAVSHARVRLPAPPLRRRHPHRASSSLPRRSPRAPPAPPRASGASSSDAAAGSSADFLPNSLGTVGAAIELRSRLQDVELERRARRGGRDGDGWEQIEGAWVRLPPGRAWGVAHFIGGAVLGAYPHIAYDAFLRRLCDDAGVVVVATPFELGVDHRSIAERCQNLFADAWGAVAAREGYDPTAAPVFAAGHSLGCKLQLIAACPNPTESGNGDGGDPPGGDVEGFSAAAEETSRKTSRARAGHLFVAFNNATAADSVRLLEKFARELIRKRAESASGGDPSASAAFEGFMRNLPSLTAMAERAASAAGLDFTPSPEETLEGARRRFESGKVRFVTFEDDDLDENDALEREVRKRYETSVAGAAPVDRVVVPGTHLSPVFIRFDGAELSPAFAKLGGLRVGDEAQVERLARESVAFLRGTDS